MTLPLLGYLQVDRPLHWHSNFNSSLSSVTAFIIKDGHILLSLMSSIPGLQKIMPSLQAEEFDVLTTQLFHSFVQYINQRFYLL